MLNALVVGGESERGRLIKLCNELKELGINPVPSLLRLKPLNEQTFIFDMEHIEDSKHCDVLIPLNSGVLKLIMIPMFKEDRFSVLITKNDMKIPVFTVCDDMLGENSILAISFLKYSHKGISFEDFIKSFLSHDSVNYLFVDKAQIRYISNFVPNCFYSPFSLWFDFQDFKPDDQDIDISFCGSLGYAEVISGYEGIFHKSLIDKIKNPAKPLFEIFLDNISFFRCGLAPSNPLFWILYKHISWEFVNPLVRVFFLGNIRRDIKVFGFDTVSFSRFTALYNSQRMELVKVTELSLTLLERGLFSTDLKGVYVLDRVGDIQFPSLDNILPQGRISFENLSEIFRRTKINILVSNMILQSGIPTKLLECLSAGGFFLTDPRYDMKDVFGDEIEIVTYRTPEELNEKIEYFLSHPKERCEIVWHLRKKFLDFMKGMTPVQVFIEFMNGNLKVFQNMNQTKSS